MLKAERTETWKRHYSKKRTALILQSLKTQIVGSWYSILKNYCFILALMHFLRHLLLVTVPKVDGLVWCACSYTWKAFLTNDTKNTVASIINGLESLKLEVPFRIKTWKNLVQIWTQQFSVYINIWAMTAVATCLRCQLYVAEQWNPRSHLPVSSAMISGENFCHPGESLTELCERQKTETETGGCTEPLTAA